MAGSLDDCVLNRLSVVRSWELLAPVDPACSFVAEPRGPAVPVRINNDELQVPVGWNPLPFDLAARGGENGSQMGVLERGTRLGAYEILSAIGAGGMGEVYQAKHLKLGRHVAIKVLHREVADDPERLRRFEREARLASTLNHPNIVTIHDIGEHAGTTYIAMEFVQGRTLRELLRDGPIPVSKAVFIASQICEGLAHAHAAGIVHRDLKPDNVMITDDGLVKILDFGLAKPVLSPEQQDSKLTTLTKATAEGVIVGTAYYMSPEQATGSPVDHRSDQFSFGVVLYELVCGRRPFEGTSVAAVLSAIMRDAPAPPISLRPETPEELSGIIERCLEKDPEKRFDLAKEIREELLRVERLGAGSGPGFVIPRKIVFASLVALVIAGIVGASWSWFRGSRARWARDEALPEVDRLVDAGEVYNAYRLAVEARNHIPDDAKLQEAIRRITMPLPVNTEPQGADVYIKEYSTPEAPWEHIGQTPIEGAGIPYTLMRWKFEKEGFETIEAAPFGLGSLSSLALGTGPPTRGHQSTWNGRRACGHVRGIGRYRRSG